MAPLFLSLLLPFSLFASASAQQKCYSLNGAELDSSYRPCNPNAQHSGCCATNRRTGSPDVCLDSGLCMATGGEYVGTIWQAGCTDPAGKDKGCPRACPVDASSSAPSTPPPPLTAWNIQPCDIGTYCCRSATDRGSCCANASAAKFRSSSLGTLILPVRAAVESESSSSSSSPSTPSPSATSTLEPETKDVRATANSTGTPIPLSTTPANSTCAAPSSTETAKVAGAVGGSLSAVILGLCALLFWMYKRERRQRKLKEHYEEQFGQNWAWRRTVVVGSEEGLVKGESEKDGEGREEEEEVEEGDRGRKAGEGRRVG